MQQPTRIRRLTGMEATRTITLATLRILAMVAFAALLILVLLPAAIAVQALSS